MAVQKVNLDVGPIIVTPHHQCLFVFIYFPPTHIITYSSSSEDLSSVQLSSPIIPHQNSRIFFFIRLYIYWLFHHPHQDNLYQINYRHPPSSVSIFSIHLTSPHSRPYSSSSSDLSSVQLYSPIILHKLPHSDTEHVVIYRLCWPPHRRWIMWHQLRTGMLPLGTL